MFFKRSSFCALGVVSGVLMATGVYATATSESEGFENFAEGAEIGVASTAVTGWYGYGAVSNTAARTLVAGTPLEGSHNRHIVVDGWVSNSFSTVTGDSRLDMLVQAARPEDELSEMTDAEAKFALAIDSTGKLNYWKVGSPSAWQSLGDTVYAEGQWIRVTLVLKSNRCKVSVDGQACVTAGGYAADTGVTLNGAWYPLVQNTTKIASMKVIGTTALDDVLLTSETTPSYKDSTGQDIVIAGTEANVPLAWYDENNLPTNQVNATDGSGMTLAAKYATGLSPTDGVKFEMKSMTMIEDNNVVKAVITIPSCNPPAGYDVKIQTSSNGTSWDSGTDAENMTSVTLDLGGSDVTYFRMVSVPAQ